MIGFSFGSSTKKQEQQAQTDPWAPTQPYLKDFLGSLGKTASAAGVGASTGSGLNTAEKSAFDALSSNASAGNPWAGQIGKVTSDIFGTTSNSGQVQDAAKAMSAGLADYANGKNLDFNSNPYVQSMLDRIKSDAGNSINAQFAGAGRDLSGDHAKALGRGIAEGEAPVLFSAFNEGQNKQIDAVKSIFGAQTGAAQGAQALDKDALTTRAGGADMAKEALDAKNYGPNAQLAIAEQLKKLPFDQLGWIAQYLFPAAGLGQQSQGTGTSTQTGFGITGKLI